MSTSWSLCMSEQEQLARILDNCELWVFDPETAIERLFYSDSFRIGKAVLPRTNVRSRHGSSPRAHACNPRRRTRQVPRRKHLSQSDPHQKPPQRNTLRRLLIYRLRAGFKGEPLFRQSV